MKKEIHTDQAPKAIGPYSQAYQAGPLLFTSGQIPLTSEGEIIAGDVIKQTHQVFNNLQAVLEAGGAGLNDVVKVTIFITNLNNFANINEVYASYFGNHRPARSFVEVSRLPKDVEVEIEAIAFIEEKKVFSI
ncbi:RidA family protein [Metabacillus idriensis]|uniref:RidA family protein n=1 Tax=Metabacillus idriensis TaxID=324768 RepID=UPI0008A96616|nr:RidA family protein [Metabacillus idriensis]MCM3598158.1 RidA family protein [Metabacillus idriensis]OHR63747.1 deaminase [Bacillus sp. HMSC76G11]